MKTVLRSLLLAFILCLVFSGMAYAGKGKAHKTENIIFVMTDGLRWQEVFFGAEESLLTKEHGVAIPELSQAAFWRNSPEARREALMPFLWKVMAQEGQVFGNQAKGSIAQVSNGLNFSYPGYSETFCGIADPRVDSNKKIPNPNLNVLEWLNGMRRYRNHVAVFGAWELFPYILNRQRSGLFINAGYEPISQVKLTPTYQVLNRLKDETTRLWHGEPLDSLTFETSLEYFKNEKPRVFFLSLGETDEWGHEGRYDKYLETARMADNCVKILWETAQSMRRYRNKTTLIFSTDHGRGNAPEGWKSHGEEMPNSENICMAFMGPDTPALGERNQTERVTASQIAATLAAFLGEDYRTAVPKAGEPIRDVLPQN
ncbi:MAG TPA: alkaline phosphatase family protein [Candidatus Hydrogenedentes bacterium]|nr:alkaline phosphatase family protein [Candidatus Hydrogenedentota bacterium]